jgi:hypothetical protein
MFRIIVTHTNGTEQALEFDKDQVMVGRHKKCDIILDFPDIDGRHAVFLLHDAELVVVDAASETGSCFVHG